MKSEPQAPGGRSGDWWPRIFAGLFGAFLGLCLLKFGNPPITEKYVNPPAGIWEFLLGYPWPIAWAYRLLFLVAAAGLVVAIQYYHRWTQPRARLPIANCQLPTAGRQMETRSESSYPRSSMRICGSALLALPLVWLIWQLIAGANSVDHSLTSPTLKHFVAGALCFYLGYFSLSRVNRLSAFWLGLVGGFLLVVAVGWEQQFGGLQQSRRYFFLYVYPYMPEVPPEYLKKISSDRIFSTLFYPNTLAGVLLLLLPATLAILWRLRTILTAGARWFLIGLVGVASLACLYWSGSKGGWLLMLLLGLVALLRLPFRRQVKVGLVTTILLAGLAGFFWRYSTFFQKGATSVGARFDYWRAAVQTVNENPLFGTGPGTFAIAYQKIKRPESEMARLVHNDYLEQASDSGVPGLVTYAMFIVGALAWSYPRAGGRARHCVRAADAEQRPNLSGSQPGAGVHGVTRPTITGDDTAELPSHAPDWLTFAVWLGVLGWSLQSLFEFGLYIPALAWPAFALLGWLLARKNSAV